MSILIKGMEMPKSCSECPLFESKYHYHGCHAVPKSFNDMDMWNFVGDRPSWCPLIELPPHGRLIVEDDAIETAWMILAGIGYRSEENPQLEQTVREVYATAPTIEVE